MASRRLILGGSQPQLMNAQGQERKSRLIESGDIRYFCESCGVLMELLAEDRVIRCPSCGRLIRRGVCATWDASMKSGRVQIIVKWTNARGTKTLRAWRTPSF